MTPQETIRAFEDGVPVTYNDIAYLKINAIIYRKENSRITAHAELLDKNRRSVLIVPVRMIKREESYNHE